MQQVILSRVVSLSLALRYDDDVTYDDTHLPALVAPALTELVLDDIKLAPDSEQLSWLPDLPKLRRLVLTDVSTTSSQLPQGVLACSRLTELVLDRPLVGGSNQMHDDNNPQARSRLCSFPAAGAHLSQLVRLSMSGNALKAVPLCLTAATALEALDMGKQRLGEHDHAQHGSGEPVQGLQVLNSLPRLRFVTVTGFRTLAAHYRQFRAAHPELTIVAGANAWRPGMIWSGKLDSCTAECLLVLVVQSVWSAATCTDAAMQDIVFAYFSGRFASRISLVADWRSASRAAALPGTA